MRQVHHLWYSHGDPILRSFRESTLVCTRLLPHWCVPAFQGQSRIYGFILPMLDLPSPSGSWQLVQSSSNMPKNESKSKQNRLPLVSSSFLSSFGLSQIPLEIFHSRTCFFSSLYQSWGFLQTTVTVPRRARDEAELSGHLDLSPGSWLSSHEV